jgi:hypothetical protein
MESRKIPTPDLGRVYTADDNHWLGCKFGYDDETVYQFVKIAAGTAVRTDDGLYIDDTFTAVRSSGVLLNGFAKATGYDASNATYILAQVDQGIVSRVKMNSGSGIGSQAGEQLVQDPFNTASVGKAQSGFAGAVNLDWVVGTQVATGNGASAGFPSSAKVGDMVLVDANTGGVVTKATNSNNISISGASNANIANKSWVYFRSPGNVSTKLTAVGSSANTAEVSGTGTLNVLSNSVVVTGNNTLFLSELEVGDFINCNQGAYEQKIVTVITNNTSLNVNSNWANTATTKAYTYFYIYCKAMLRK